MREKILGVIIILLSAVFVFSGFKISHTNPLQSIDNEQPSFSTPDKGLFISYKVYTPKECDVYLDHNLIKNGVQPIQLSIQNNTVHSYILTSDEIDIPILELKNVTRKYIKEILPKSLAFRALSVLYLPLAIPGLVYDIVTTKALITMKRDYQAKMIKEEGEVLLPYSLVNRVIFVASDKEIEEFTISLLDQITGKKETYTAPIRFSVDS